MSSIEAFWSRYDALLARLLAPLTPDDGIPEEEIAAAETRLGSPLPRLLREFYRRAGNHPLLMSPADNYFVRPADLTADAGWLTVWMENQGAVHEGIRTGDTRDDPLVCQTWSLTYEDVEEGRSLSGFLTENLLWQCVAGAMPLSARSEPLQAVTGPTGAAWEQFDSEYAGGTFYVGDGVIALLMSSPSGATEVLAGARTPADAAILSASLPVPLDFIEPQERSAPPPTNEELARQREEARARQEERSRHPHGDVNCAGCSRPLRTWADSERGVCGYCGRPLDARR
jgi:hypothetical protein